MPHKASEVKKTATSANGTGFGACLRERERGRERIRSLEVPLEQFFLSERGWSE
jgi:hypothetical protein